jgi:hypothetical protein
MTHRLALLICFALLVPIRNWASTAAAEPTYLVILGDPETFAEAFRPQPPENPRQVGFGTLIYTLKTPTDAIREQVEDALDTAERTGYPVLFQLDDWNFPEQSQDPALVEWTDWPQEGTSHGPLVKRRWINWGTWFTAGPPPNFESPRFRAQLEQRIEEAIAKPIAARLDRWRAEGKGYLFAGVVVGWETGFYTMTHVDRSNPPAFQGRVFEEDEIVRTGYAALTTRGYTKPSIKRIAAQCSTTEEKVMDAILHDLLHDYTAFWAKMLAEGGVPHRRIYSHYTPAITHPDLVKILEGDGRLVPLDAASNPYCRPGFTITHGASYRFEGLMSALHAMNCTQWGAVEIEFVPATRGKEAAYEELSRLTDAGAKVLCIFGWWEDKDHPFAANTPDTVAAMKRWLAGNTLAHRQGGQ